MTRYFSFQHCIGIRFKYCSLLHYSFTFFINTLVYEYLARYKLPPRNSRLEGLSRPTWFVAILQYNISNRSMQCYKTWIGPIDLVRKSLSQFQSKLGRIVEFEYNSNWLYPNQCFKYQSDHNLKKRKGQE